MDISFDESLYNSLKELKIIDLKLLDQLHEESTKKLVSLSELIINRNLLSEPNLGQIIGDIVSLPYVNLAELAIDKTVLHTVPEVVARKQNVIAFNIDSKGLHLATSNPQNKQIQDFLSKKTGLKIIPHYTGQENIQKALLLYSKDIGKAFDQIIAENVSMAKTNLSSEPPIIKIVDTIINYADRNGASDIHIEPLEESTLVRFRIDGVLHDIVSLPHQLDSQIVTRIKVMSNLRTDEHQDAQDGKIIVKTPQSELDIRVSIAPITRGEKIVMRLLSEKSREFSLTELGLSKKDLEKIEHAYHLPHGMILATGPTGSGKTTTLYAILKLINKREINIMTIEDPVEYQVENINQIQTNTKTGLTFAKGLRSIVRQDPDVILVGEIRDEETAGIAVNSAMTGHLVLSSLHTNDAVTTFPRLTDMKVEPYLIASTVNIVIAQRLVRKICPKCKVSGEVQYKDLDLIIQKYIEKDKNFLTYRGKGCELCHQTGYLGRIGIFEILTMNPELNTAVTAKKMFRSCKVSQSNKVCALCLRMVLKR